MNVEVIQGGRHVDARGMMRFCNDFDMTAVKRFYTIANSAEQPVRGWIGHKRETKWFFPVKGRTVIEVERMVFGQDLQDGQDCVGGSIAAKDAEVAKGDEVVGQDLQDGQDCVVGRVAAKDTKSRYVLDSVRPEVLKVPPGNWFCIRQDGEAEVMVFSDCRVGELEGDDFRREY